MKKRTKNIILLLLADASIIPGCLLCKWLTETMLSTDRPCQWSYFGGKCISCGGTHFVNTLVQGKFAEAFMHNQFFFILSIVLAISFVLLHLAVLGNVEFAKQILRKIYSIPGLIIGGAGLIFFLILRNSYLFIALGKILFDSIRSLFA